VTDSPANSAEPHATALPTFPYHGVSGEDLGRLLALSDGVFGFALTLLALSLVVPTFDTTNMSQGQVSSHLAYLLQQDWSAFIGYVFAFIMIAIWWVNHHRIFQFIARYNSTLVWLNMGVLLEIAVMPFVLRVYTSYTDAMVAVDLFAGIQVALGITTTLLWDYARRAKLIKPNVPPAVGQFFSRRGWFTAAIFAISIGVSFYSVSFAEYCWVSVFVAQVVVNRAGARMLA
jgi:TMEM175 potassium channel family protein